MSTALAKLNIQFIWNYLRVRVAFSCVLTNISSVVIITCDVNSSLLRVEYPVLSVTTYPVRVA